MKKMYGHLQKLGDVIFQMTSHILRHYTFPDKIFIIWIFKQFNFLQKGTVTLTLKRNANNLVIVKLLTSTRLRPTSLGLEYRRVGLGYVQPTKLSNLEDAIFQIKSHGSPIFKPVGVSPQEGHGLS